jgi:hypothetical protein
LLYYSPFCTPTHLSLEYPFCSNENDKTPFLTDLCQSLTETHVSGEKRAARFMSFIFPPELGRRFP